MVTVRGALGVCPQRSHHSASRQLQSVAQFNKHVYLLSNLNKQDRQAMGEMPLHTTRSMLPAT